MMYLVDTVTDRPVASLDAAGALKFMDEELKAHHLANRTTRVWDLFTSGDIKGAIVALKEDVAKGTRYQWEDKQVYDKRRADPAGYAAELARSIISAQ